MNTDVKGECCDRGWEMLRPKLMNTGIKDEEYCHCRRCCCYNECYEKDYQSRPKKMDNLDDNIAGMGIVNFFSKSNYII